MAIEPGLDSLKALAYRSRRFPRDLPLLFIDDFVYPSGAFLTSGDNVSGGVWTTTATEPSVSNPLTRAYSPGTNIRGVLTTANVTLDNSRPYSYGFVYSWSIIDAALRISQNGFHINAVNQTTPVTPFVHVRLVSDPPLQPTMELKYGTGGTNILYDMTPLMLPSIVNGAGSGNFVIELEFPDGNAGDCLISIDGNLVATISAGVIFNQISRLVNIQQCSLILQRHNPAPNETALGIDSVFVRGFLP